MTRRGTPPPPARTDAPHGRLLVLLRFHGQGQMRNVRLDLDQCSEVFDGIRRLMAVLEIEGAKQWMPLYGLVEMVRRAGAGRALCQIR